MTAADRPTKEQQEEEATKPPIYFTVSDASTISPPSPSSSTSSPRMPRLASSGKLKEQMSPVVEEASTKTLPGLPKDPADPFFRNYATIQPVSAMFEKNPAPTHPHIPPYLKQMHRQQSEAPSVTPSRASSGRGRRSRSKKRSRFLRSIHYIGSHHNMWGFRHIVLTMLIVIAWVLGSVMFWVIEAPAEKVAVGDTYAALHEAIDVIAEDLLRVTSAEGGVNATTMAGHVKNAYIKLLNVEGKFRWTAIDKIDSSEEGTYQWTFGSAFFFVFTLYTTVGYGTIAPGTDMGRFCTIWYSIIFYPFGLVVIRDLGQVILVWMTRVYGRLLIKIRTVRGFLTSDDESIKCPLWIIGAVSMAFIAVMGEFFHYYDANTGPMEGLNHFHAFYFSYLSYTMIGFGDLNPVNLPYSVLVAILVTAGLPLMRVITKAMVIAMENGYFGWMLFVETKLAEKIKRPDDAKGDKQAVNDAAEKGSISDSSEDEEEAEEKKIRDELMHNFTIKSLASFMTSNRDVYNGDFGRVELRKSDL